MKAVKKEDDITCDSEIITAALKKTPKRKQTTKIEILSCKDEEDDGDDADDDDDEDSQEVIPLAKLRSAPKTEAQKAK